MKISNKYQKRVQKGQITHWEHYQDILKGPTQKSWTGTFFEGGKKKRSQVFDSVAYSLQSHQNRNIFKIAFRKINYV